VKVLCVATDQDALARLRRASVGAEWELVAGATDLRGALDQLDVERPHALVVFGPFAELVALAAERFPDADHHGPGRTRGGACGVHGGRRGLLAAALVVRS
jgi:hypothetical protein